MSEYLNISVKGKHSVDLRDRNIDPKERAFVMFMRLQE
jgi:hypothetical protein